MPGWGKDKSDFLMPQFMPPFSAGMQGGLNGVPSYGLQLRPANSPVLTQGQEAAFRNWMSTVSATAGTNPNPNEYQHAYDYRKLFMNGGGMQLDPSDNLFHAPSAYKMPYHPNRFVYHNGSLIDSITGQKISPMMIMQQLLR